MNFSIRVQKNPECSSLTDQYFFAKDFNTDEELQSVVNLCDNKRRVDLFESLVIPVRTNNTNNFCKDFFLPAFLNHALTIEDIAVKIFLSIAFLPLDILTLPLRLITVIPRYIYNKIHSKESHPFYQYLISNGVPAEKLTDDHIYLETTKQEGQQLITHGNTFNFIELPTPASIINKLFEIRGLPNQQELQEA